MKPTKTSFIASPKDFFLHLLSIVTLYLAAIHVGLLGYQLINIKFPDPLEYSWNPDSYFGPLRWAIATLAIVFPVYLWTRKQLGKEYAENPEKKELKSRKWMIYFTIFLAALIIIGDLVALLNRFLEGDLTSRFALKVVLVFLIAGTILAYYRWDLNPSKTIVSLPVKAFNWCVIGLVATFLLLGFVAVGSPQQQRLRRFDQQRVGDLQMIQSQIVNYWQSKDVLPGNLSVLKDDISGFTSPVDPATQQPYEYQVVDETTFKLCATFASAVQQPQPGKIAPGESMPRALPFDNWDHSEGYYCFERTIDPELYPPFPDKAVRPAR